MGHVKCTACGKHHGYCSEVAAQLTGTIDRPGNIYTNPGKPYKSWWDDEMEKQMDLGAHYDKDSKKGGKKFKQRPFLKAENIAKNGSTCKILDFREAPKQMEYSDFLCDVSIGKKEYTWGLRSKSVTLNMLMDALGKRTEKWIGKTLKLVRGGPKGQYVNVG
jgi:hypothetical protein